MAVTPAQKLSFHLVTSRGGGAAGGHVGGLCVPPLRDSEGSGVECRVGQGLVILATGDLSSRRKTRIIEKVRQDFTLPIKALNS